MSDVGTKHQAHSQQDALVRFREADVPTAAVMHESPLREQSHSRVRVTTDGELTDTSTVHTFQVFTVRQPSSVDAMFDWHFVS